MKLHLHLIHHIACLVWMLGLAACVDTPGDTSTTAQGQGQSVLPVLLMDHGLRLGAEMTTSVALSCSDGAVRIPGRDMAVQIVTFATPYDCSKCDEHIAGIKDIAESGTVRGTTMYVVTWAPNKALLHRTIEGFDGALPICSDEHGALWDAYGISHTPVTAVIKDGRIEYLTDAPLDRTPYRQQFLTYVKRLVAAGSGMN